MGSALLDTTPGTAPDSAAAKTEAAARMNTGEALRQQAAERLAAHRSKRAGLKPGSDSVQHATNSGNTRAAQIAAAVAERYANSQSYRAFLAEEAERAVQQARAAAEVAAMQAEAMEAAQQSLLDALDNEAAAEPSEIVPETVRTPEPAVMSEELSFWPETEPPAKPVRPAAPKSVAKPAAAYSPEARPAPAAAASFAVRIGDNVALPPRYREAMHENRAFQHDGIEALALDEEIAFRHAPVFEEFVSRPEPLPANLIEFPRQLVASRKARPRYAEGPLREEQSEAADGQLRIFEVETAQISTEPAVEEPQAAQWTSIFLDTPQRMAAPVAETAPSATTSMPPGAASVARRTAAVAINGCIIGLVLAASVAAAMVASGDLDTLRTLTLGDLAHTLLSRNPEGGPSLLGVGVLATIFLSLVYQALFFTFSTSTPGMRCVRIGLCTFSDENPTRKAMRRRIVAILLSVVPFGLGFIWAALDEEKLSWHDRVSGMYQRQY
jgi:uncharacterized RDD family membrane protein YckC